MGLKNSESQIGVLIAAAHLIRTGRLDIGAELVEKLCPDNVHVTGVGDYDRCQLVRLNLEREFKLGGLDSIEPGFDH
ncbi:hypothetical protein [Pseudomonas viridiflava]|uniref:hypothetical protein n=1 Tax=Pseudomonas viridiflava TaxID=33069 RepID=UPI000F05794A|nr:hypothetical protein [Pseudomonas viridiflava]